MLQISSHEPELFEKIEARPRKMGRTLKLLAVDDCQDYLKALSTALADLGHEVRVAYNGELALLQINDFEPRCVLFDINMPVMNGYELAQTLRTYLDEQTVLIGMSGALPSEPLIASATPLVDRWFRKPIDIEDLESYLAQVSERSSPYPADY